MSRGLGDVYKRQDKGETGRKRTVYLLGLRVFFATVLIILIAIGLYTGELGNSVPWQDS